MIRWESVIFETIFCDSWIGFMDSKLKFMCWTIHIDTVLPHYLINCLAALDDNLDFDFIKDMIVCKARVAFTILTSTYVLKLSFLSSQISRYLTESCGFSSVSFGRITNDVCRFLTTFFNMNQFWFAMIKCYMICFCPVKQWIQNCF
jgi:hypothetical protein